jgi:uroporphyrinogen-III decarboxylase
MVFKKPDNWAAMTWQQRRDERFKHWLSPENVKFVSPEAEKLYKERVTRFVKTIKLEEPDRVPVILPVGYYPAYNAGISFRTMMYDVEAMRSAWLKFMHDFPDMDTFYGPVLVSPGKIMEALQLKIQKWPGYGLPEDATFHQFVEDEYMKADEYDEYIHNVADFTLRKNLPRTTGLFKPFEKLPTIRMLGRGMSWVAMFTDPEIRKTFQTLMDLAPEFEKWQNVVREVSNQVLAAGYPNVRALGAGAPFDMLADMMRGTRGIAMDIYRQPEKIIEAVEYLLPYSIEQALRMADIFDSPVRFMPLHKGDDVFMSDAQFEKFYWPTFRKLLLAMINEGLVPFPFAEGKFNRRLEQIADTPRSGVIWYFDQTDMKEAKKVLGNVSCIAGNTPSSLMVTGTPAQVKENCRQLIEDCAPGGGYILTGGAGVDRGNPDNFRAMMDAACEYGIY